MCYPSLQSLGFKTTLNTRPCCLPKTMPAGQLGNKCTGDSQQKYNTKTRVKKQKAKWTPKYHNQTRDRNTAISMNYGERTLNVLSINPDSFNNDFQRDCLYKMEKTIFTLRLCKKQD